MNGTLPENDDSSLENLESTYTKPAPPSPEPRFSRPSLSRTTLLIVIVVAVILLSGLIFYILRHNTTKKVLPPNIVTINTQSLDNGTLNKLIVQAGPDNQTKQQLTISPDTIFKSDVEVQGSEKVGKDLDVGGNLNVKGTTTLQSATTINNNLAVRGSLSVGGVLSAPSLSIGTLNTTTINASGSVKFGGHLVPSGATPQAKPSVATSGGSIIIDGNDTAGTVTINMGGGTLFAGELVIVTFREKYSGTPKVQLTPVTSDASKLDYYVTRSPSFFTINTSSTPTSGASYVFDYLVTQ